MNLFASLLLNRYTQAQKTVGTFMQAVATLAYLAKAVNNIDASNIYYSARTYPFFIKV
jgi:hypothetical protein